ncbi:MAG: helix-turn-helix transcriptional regulator [Candidatus Binatus sp.]|jgi:transcriptional regulator with XRE-family HTH domain
MARRTNITERFGRRVRELRQRANLSQEEFAERCDLDRTYISGIERGKRNVALRNIEAIAQALNITISELLKVT